MIEVFKKNWFFIIVGVVIVIFIFIIPRFDGEADYITVSGTQDDSSDDQLIKESVTVIVDVKGEVRSPGVYEIESDSRINDVIMLAGGFTEEADQFFVNLAQKVQDEMTIMVPKKGADDSTGQNGATKVKINYATVEEIETLNGIGPSKANAIIQYREEYGFFKSVDDLLNVSGIGEKTLDNIRDDIQVP